jgi:hypothetical protein
LTRVSVEVCDGANYTVGAKFPSRRLAPAALIGGDKVKSHAAHYTPLNDEQDLAGPLRGSGEMITIAEVLETSELSWGVLDLSGGCGRGLS